MTWFVILFVSIILSSGASLLQKAVLRDRRIDSTAFAIYYQVAVGLLFFVYLLFIGFDFSGFSEKWLNLILTVVLYGFGGVLVCRMVQKIDISEFTIVFQISAFFSVLFSWIFLGEILNLYQWGGFFLIFSGIMISLWEHKIIIRKNDLIVVLSAAILALAFINDVYIIKSVHLETYLFLAFLLPGLVVWAFNKKATQSFRYLFIGKNKYYSLGAAISIFLCSVPLFLAYKMINNAAQISSLTKISTIIIVIFGILFFNERKRVWQKIFGSILAVAGVFLLA